MSSLCVFLGTPGTFDLAVAVVIAVLLLHENGITFRDKTIKQRFPFARFPTRHVVLIVLLACEVAAIVLLWLAR